MSAEFQPKTRKVPNYALLNLKLFNKFNYLKIEKDFDELSAS